MTDDDVTDLDPEMLVRMGCIETLNEGDIDKTEKYYTDDATYYPSDDEELTLDDLIADALDFQQAFPDVEASIGEVIVDGDQVTFHYTVRGTHEAPFREIPTTGKTFESGGIGFASLEDGLIDDYSLVFDRLGMLDQLGVMG